jgi:hypothetical protein
MMRCICSVLRFELFQTHQIARFKGVVPAAPLADGIRVDGVLARKFGRRCAGINLL